MKARWISIMLLICCCSAHSQERLPLPSNLGQYLPEAKTIVEFAEWFVRPTHDMSALQQLLESSAATPASQREQRIREMVRKYDAVALRQMIEEAVERAKQDPALMARIEKTAASFRASDAELNKVSTLELSESQAKPRSLAEQIRQGSSKVDKIDFDAPGILSVDVGAPCSFALNGVTLSAADLVGSATAVRRILESPGVVAQNCVIDAKSTAMVDTLLRRARRLAKKDIPTDLKANAVLVRTHAAEEFLRVVDSSTSSSAMCVRKSKVCLDAAGKTTGSVTLSCGKGPELTLTTDGSLALSSGPVTLKIGSH